MRRLPLFFLVLLLSAACGQGPSDGGGTTPESFVLTRIPPTLQAPLFSEAREPITPDNVHQIAFIGRLDPPPPAATVFASALSPDETRLVGLTTDWLTAWDLLTGQRVWQTSRYEALTVHYSPDKTEIYLPARVNDALIVTVIDAETGAEITTLTAHSAPATWTFAVDAGWFAVGGQDGSIRVWDLAERTALVTIPGGGLPIAALAFSPDGERLISADGAAARLWDWRARTAAAELTLDGGDVLVLAPDPDAARIALGTTSEARIWNLSEGGERRLDTGGPAEIVRFSPDGRLILAGGAANGLNVWDSASLALAGRLPDVVGSRVSAAFTADDLLITTALAADLTAVRGHVSLWNASAISEQTIPRADLPVDAPIVRAEWTLDQRLLLLYSTAGPIYLWGIPPGTASP
ncbi:MAG: WD40 repeat domain-containing protein [Candidatus Flexifilum sp.]|jgi:WD40 repeat protein